MNDKEIWMPINGYETLYLISNTGKVKSLGRDIIIRGVHKICKSKILVPALNKHNGYFCVYLFKEGNRRKYYIHKLVAEHFIPKPDNKKIIDHIDGVKTNNNSNNLRWVNHFENSCCNANTPTTDNRPILQYTLNGVFLKEYRSAVFAANELNINQANIVHCLKGKYKQSGGFIWKYKSDN